MTRNLQDVKAEIACQLEQKGFRDVRSTDEEGERRCVSDGETMLAFQGFSRGRRFVAIFVCPVCGHGTQKLKGLLLRHLPTEA